MSEPKSKDPKSKDPKDKKIEPSPEELQRHMLRAKCRFRALVRRVIDNIYWLAEAVEEYDGDDVKKRVEQAIRKSKKKRLLNINDKALLNKPAVERTEQEKKYLYRIIGGLKCFKRYPDHVKRKLAAVTYFKYYGPDRVIVRQNQEAYATYFIVTGDINISLLIYDEYLQKHVSVVVGQMHPGDMFGEVSLLHNIKRTATCTTIGHCEFLALMKEDFENVLLVSLQHQWDQIRHAMSSFSYFNSYDEVGLREGCIVAKMKSFKRNDTIMGDGRGDSTFVYFVLSGRCRMIESLQINITTDVKGSNVYSLYDPYVDVSDNEINFFEKCLRSISLRKRQKTLITDDPQEPSKSVPTVKSSSQNNNDPNSVDIKKVESLETSSKLHTPHASRQEKRYTFDESRRQGDANKQSRKLQDTTNQEPPDVKKDDVTANTKPIRNESVRRTIFMQVCEFLPGATFGLGENMRDRRIIALTDVDCMLLPYVWLMQRNTVNIWSRVKHYLSMKIPTKQKLFEELVNDRRWTGYRDKMLKEFGYTSLTIQGKDNQINMTSISDVPYSIRIEEIVDL